MKMRRGRNRGAFVLVPLAVMAIACGTEPLPPVVTKQVGGLVPVAKTRAAVHRYAADAAAAAGAKLIVVNEKKQSCDDDSARYAHDVYWIEGSYQIGVAPTGRAAAVKQIRSLWKSQGFKLDDDPGPNDVEAETPNHFFVGLQPARGSVTLPLYVNSSCRTNPRSTSQSPSG